LGLAVPGGSSTGSVTLVEFDVTAPLDNIVAAIGNADAVVCATGFTPTASNWGGLKPNSSIAVDKQGTINLIDASKSSGVGHFVLVSSLLTNGADCKQTDNANYKVLQAFGGVLASKREAEVYLQKSGLDFTVVRPGGLSNEPATGGIVAQGADTLFGTDGEVGREISRDLVAEVAIEALFQASADRKLSEWVTAVMSGQVKSSLRSAPPPVVSGLEPLVTVVASTFEDLVLGADVDVLLLVTTPWCDSCEAVEEAVVALADRWQDEPKLRVCRFDASVNDLPRQVRLERLPTILFVKAGTREGHSTEAHDLTHLTSEAELSDAILGLSASNLQRPLNLAQLTEAMELLPQLQREAQTLLAENRRMRVELADLRAASSQPAYTSGTSDGPAHGDGASTNV